MNIENKRIAIVGLGYVGLPLAVAFAQKYFVLGFDINTNRVAQLEQHNDYTLEVETTELKAVITNNIKSRKGLFVSTYISADAECDIYIITVPTPTDKYNRPDLTPLINASRTIGKILKKGDIVIYESTVYPGVTEEEMMPILEKESGMVFNKDFFCGYSPERINPGDKDHKVTNILKITSGSTPKISETIDILYRSIIKAGTYQAPSIKVAEAAKVIENSQRDINIAFVNELSKIFNLLGIDSHEVLEAAATKWNFLPFKPGLVGGHCIGVDPYYLAQKAQEVGYHPEIILSGRRINDSMGKYVVTETIKHMLRKNIQVVGARVLILGFAFKENCPDVRNTRVLDIYNELKAFDMKVDVYDPWADSEEVSHEYGIEMINKEIQNCINDYSAIILAVAHKDFEQLNLQRSDSQVIFDVKGLLPKTCIDARL